MAALNSTLQTRRHCCATRPRCRLLQNVSASFVRDYVHTPALGGATPTLHGHHAPIGCRCCHVLHQLDTALRNSHTHPPEHTPASPEALRERIIRYISQSYTAWTAVPVEHGRPAWRTAHHNIVRPMVSTVHLGDPQDCVEDYAALEVQTHLEQHTSSISKQRDAAWVQWSRSLDRKS